MADLSTLYIQWSFDYLKQHEICEAWESALYYGQPVLSGTPSVKELLDASEMCKPDMGPNLERKATAFDAMQMKHVYLHDHQSFVKELKRRRHHHVVFDIGPLLKVSVAAEKLLRLKETTGAFVWVNHQLRMVKKFIHENAAFLPPYKVETFHRLVLNEKEEQGHANIIDLNDSLFKFKNAWNTRKDSLDAEWITLVLQRMHRVQQTLELCDTASNSIKRNRPK